MSMQFNRALKAMTGLVLGTCTLMAAAQTSFSSTYTGGTGSCGSTYRITGKEPSAPGKYPVFVYIGGTGESYRSNWAEAAIDAAVARGMVAASVEYDNGTFGSCTTISSRARCIFDPARASSAIARLCARDKADCAKGVVTGGLSQGSIISVLSRNHEPRVQASFGQGTGTAYSVYDLSACMADGRHTQSSDRLRLINGERDLFVGGTEASARASAQRVTGLTGCSGTSCFRSNGSGWAVVKDAQVADLYADHCFMGTGGLYGNQCLGLLVDPYYEYGSGAWALPATMDWLKTFTQP